MPRANNQPTYKRQRFLLAFIRQLSKSVTATDLQKLVFLTSMQDCLDYYEFVPFKYGSYSFQLAEDVDILCREEFLIRHGSRVQAIGDYEKNTRFGVASERGDELLRKAYRKYPYYSINSEILERLFDNTEIARFVAERENYTKPGQMLFTIGYEGRSVEAFVNTLLSNDVRVLCDVRRNPLSRKFGFSKSRLSHIVEASGIDYVHLPRLGIDSHLRADLGTMDDYANLFNNYARTLPQLKGDMDVLYQLYVSKRRIALMCYEKESKMCHRHVIRDELVDMHGMRSVDL